MNKEYTHRYCVNMECITNGMDKLADLHYPDQKGKLFDGTIGIASPLKKYLENVGKEIPVEKGIKWVEV